MHTHVGSKQTFDKAGFYSLEATRGSSYACMYVPVCNNLLNTLNTITIILFKNQFSWVQYPVTLHRSMDIYLAFRLDRHQLAGGSFAFRLPSQFFRHPSQEGFHSRSNHIYHVWHTASNDFFFLRKITGIKSLQRSGRQGAQVTEGFL